MTLTFLRGQIQFMTERGIEVHVASSPGSELGAFGEQFAIPTHGVRMTRQITPLRDVLALVELWRLTRALRPDIVHAHTPKAGLLGMIAAAAAGVPARFYHMRGLPVVEARGPKRQLLLFTERIACALATRVLCVSHSLSARAKQLNLVREDKIEVFQAGSGNGVDAVSRFNPDRLAPDVREAIRAEYNIPRDALVVGFVGRIVRDKGVMELASAWEGLRRDFPQAYLLVVGLFENEDAVPADVRSRLESDPSVRLIGLRWDTPPIYAAMDVVVLPTYREGLPNVPLEAAAMMLPVVATLVDGCVDAVSDGQTGILVPARDAKALEGAIRTYLLDDALRRRHGAAGRERMLHLFQPQAIWKSVYGAYVKATARPVGRSD